MSGTPAAEHTGVAGMGSFKRRAVAAVAVVAMAVPAMAAASAPEPDSVFEPAPASEPVYGTKPPDADPDNQVAVLEAHDGVDLYVETWLPAPKDGNVPPEQVPTVLIMTPYAPLYGALDVLLGPDGFAEDLTSRGYAVAHHHVRGTGSSGGCLEQTAANQIDDGARVVEFLGRDASWSNGNVGMYGVSYDAETQLSVAGLGDPEKTQYLKAIVPVASVGGQYEWSFFDGVPYTGFATQGMASYLAVSALPGQQTAPQHVPEKLPCQPELFVGSLDMSGDMTEMWAAREYRPGAPNISAATLFVHGLADQNVQPITIAGFFDRIPDTTPHKGLFGVWDHATPDSHGAVAPEWERTDWMPMVIAWFDRYLKGLDTGVEDWPDVQVQASDGQWRVEPDFPTTGGPAGQLVLTADGGLGGESTPAGTTTYTELGDLRNEDLEGGRAVFQTEQLSAPLQLTGQPVLDLWLKTDEPDGHIAAMLEVIGPDGELARFSGSWEQEIATYGLRSLRHLDDLTDGRFAQAEGRPAPVDTAIRVPVRFQPTDLVVPEGGRLRLTIGGAVSYGGRDSMPSGAVSTITLLHDCGQASALRFLMPTPGSTLLNVRERGETGPLDPVEAVQPLSDGGGLASGEVCGQPPERLAPFGPAR